MLQEKSEIILKTQNYSRESLPRIQKLWQQLKSIAELQSCSYDRHVFHTKSNKIERITNLIKSEIIQTS